MTVGKMSPLGNLCMWGLTRKEISKKAEATWFVIKGAKWVKGIIVLASYPRNPRNDVLHYLGWVVLAIGERWQRAYERTVQTTFGDKRRLTIYIHLNVNVHTWLVVDGAIYGVVCANGGEQQDFVNPFIPLFACDIIGIATIRKRGPESN